MIRKSNYERFQDTKVVSFSFLWYTLLIKENQNIGM